MRGKEIPYLSLFLKILWKYYDLIIELTLLNQNKDVVVQREGKKVLQFRIEKSTDFQKNSSCFVCLEFPSSETRKLKYFLLLQEISFNSCYYLR